MTSFKAVVPRLAFGAGTSWFVGPAANNDAARALNQSLVTSQLQALEAGVHHIDAAEVYGTEDEQGEAIKQFLANHSELQRENLFVTSKVRQNITDVRGSIEAVLKRLGLQHLDLYLIHSPWVADSGYKGTLAEAWKEMEALVDAGLTKFIGVSNFQIPHMEEILTTARIKPVVNQIEYNPYLQQTDLVDYLVKHDVMIACYTPLVSLTASPNGPVDSVVDQLAAKYGRSAAQILLKWSLSKDHIVVTTTSKQERMVDYVQALDPTFQLTADEIASIDTAGSKHHFRVHWKGKF